MSEPAALERTGRMAWLGRLWPNSLAGRVALVLAGGLLALLVAAVGFDWHDRRNERFQFYVSAVVERIVAVVEELEATPEAERARLARLVNSRRFNVHVSETKPALQPLPWHIPDSMRGQVRAYLAQLGDRPVSLGYLGPWNDDSEHRSPRLLVAVGLKDGNWALFRVSSPHPRPSRGFGFVAALGFVVLVIVLASAWAAHRMTRPLRQFAAAADNLGLDVRSPQLEERGSRELRRATRAFNTMQERIRRLVDDRTMMLAAISHDLKTALTRLRLRAEFIEDEEQQAKALADLDEMQSMLEATLSFARDDAAEEHPTPLNLASMLQSLCADLADAGHEVSYDGPDRLSTRGRPVALRRAFANLIDNAVRYGGGAEVGLAGDADGVTVSIADRGPGIPAERREDVFRPFFRLESSRSRETGGTGLGLAVARSIVHRHGGEIALADREGGGTLVNVSLPHATASTDT